MSSCILVIGNKNYSSWSMRAWLVLAQAGIPFEEITVPLGQEPSKQEISKYSPSGKVPVLIDGECTIWDSLAIAEYAAEQAPERRLWPTEAGARAIARSVSAEMHAGFQALRANMPMNIRASKPGVGHTPEVLADIERITRIWRDCRQRFGGAGPFLFGGVGIADAVYAPVVTRFATYAVDLDPVCRAYADAVLAWPPVVAWAEAARAESWTVPEFEKH